MTEPDELFEVAQYLWSAQRLVEAVGRYRRSSRFLVHDRDSIFGGVFRRRVRGLGVRSLKTPPRSPQSNAYSERFVLSIRSECLDRIVPLGERHLRRVISEFVEHNHFERNHQGIANRLIFSAFEPANTNGRVARCERLGGLLNLYHRSAA